MSVSLTPNQSYIFCSFLNMTLLFNCNPDDVIHLNFNNWKEVNIFMFYSISRLSIVLFILWTLQTMFVLYLHYKERKRLKNGTALWTWRKNLYLTNRMLRVMWSDLKPKNMIVNVFNESKKSFVQESEFFANNLQYINTLFNFKNCVNGCGNKTKYEGECLFCLYHKDTQDTMLPARKLRILTILCMQRRYGTVWSTLPVDFVRNFTKTLHLTMGQAQSDNGNRSQMLQMLYEMHFNEEPPHIPPLYYTRTMRKAVPKPSGRLGIRGKRCIKFDIYHDSQDASRDASLTMCALEKLKRSDGRITVKLADYDGFKRCQVCFTLADMESRPDQ